MKKSYTVTKDADMLAPKWLAVRINYTTIKFLYRIIDSAETLKGVRICGETARIGDRIVFDGKRLSVERRCSGYLPLGRWVMRLIFMSEKPL